MICLKNKILFIALLFSTMFGGIALQGDYQISDNIDFSFSTIEKENQLMSFLDEFEEVFDLYSLQRHPEEEGNKNAADECIDRLTGFFKKHGNYLTQDCGRPAFALLNRLLDIIKFNYSWDFTDFYGKDMGWVYYVDEQEQIAYENLRPLNFIVKCILPAIGEHIAGTSISDEYETNRALLVQRFHPGPVGSRQNFLLSYIATIFLFEIEYSEAKYNLYSHNIYLAHEFLKRGEFDLARNRYLLIADSIENFEQFIKDAEAYIEIERKKREMSFNRLDENSDL